MLRLCCILCRLAHPVLLHPIANSLGSGPDMVLCGVVFVTYKSPGANMKTINSRSHLFWYNCCINLFSISFRYKPSLFG